MLRCPSDVPQESSLIACEHDARQQLMDAQQHFVLSSCSQSFDSVGDGSAARFTNVVETVRPESDLVLNFGVERVPAK